MLSRVLLLIYYILKYC